MGCPQLPEPALRYWTVGRNTGGPPRLAMAGRLAAGGGAAEDVPDNELAQERAESGGVTLRLAPPPGARARARAGEEE